MMMVMMMMMMMVVVVVMTTTTMKTTMMMMNNNVKPYNEVCTQISKYNIHIWTIIATNKTKRMAFRGRDSIRTG